MSKFLEILEEHDPANESKMDAALEAKMFLHEKKIPFTSKGNKIILHTQKGNVVLEAVKNYQINPDKIADDAIDSYDQAPIYKKPFMTTKRQLKKTKEEGDKKVIPKLNNYLKRRNEETLNAIDKASQTLRVSAVR